MPESNIDAPSPPTKNWSTAIFPLNRYPPSGYPRAEQVTLVASMIASRLLLGPCAALQQVQVLLEVAIQHHYDIMPAQHFEHRFQRLHGPSQETKLKLQLLLASLRSKCAATPEEAAGAAISIPRGMSARGIN